MRQRFVHRFVIGILVAGGLLFFLFLIFFSEWRDWRDSDSWQAVTTREFTIQPKSSSVRYRYVVDDRVYEGDRIHFFVLAPFQDDRVLGWIDGNRQVTELTVYYDPEAPERAVLVRTGLTDVWFMQFVLICGVAGIVVLVPVLFFGGLWRWLWRQFQTSAN
jgi:hypothetical protein